MSLEKFAIDNDVEILISCDKQINGMLPVKNLRHSEHLGNDHLVFSKTHHTLCLSLCCKQFPQLSISSKNAEFNNSVCFQI